MANITGGSGYKQLKRIGNYTAPQINKAADRTGASIDDAINRGIAERDKDKARLDSALAGISVDVDALQSKATGFEGRDDVARDFAMAARRRSEKYAELAREAASKSDWEAMHNYKAKINRIKGDFKNTVNDEAILKEVFDKYRTAWQNGDIDDDDWLDFAEASENFDYEVILDENDNKVIRALTRDNEGNVTGVVEKKWSEVVNQKDRPFEVVRLEDRNGKKGLISDLLATMGKRKYDEVGNYITTTQTWDEQAERQFKAKVIGLQSNNRTMHSLLKQAGGEPKKSGFTEADKTLVENFLREQVKGGYDTVESKKARSLNPDEVKAENARNRAVTVRGQDLAKERGDEQNKLNWDKQALAWWKAKNPKEKASTGKAAQKQEKVAKVAKLYDIAKEISKTDLTDKAVKEVLGDTGLGFTIGTDWQLNAGINNLFGGDYNEFDIGSVKNINQKDVFKIVKGLARKVGLELEDTDIRDIIMSEQVESKTEESNTPPNSTDKDPLGLGL